MEPYLSRMKAVSDQTRMRLLRVLIEAGTSLCLSELVDIVRRPQYAVSRAMGALTRAGLVTEERRGRLVFFTLNVDPFNEKLFETLRSVPADDDPYPLDSDRLRWRLDLREDGRCVITYTAGYNPPAYTTTEEDGLEEEKPSVLFVCVHNSARSQIAEEYMRRFAGDLLNVDSAGLTPGELNPFVVELLQEDGIDISQKKTQSVVDLYKSGNTYSYVITVCSREAEENCPVFPGPVRRLSWPFPDPSRFEGTREEILEKTRQVRDVIKEEVRQFVEAYRARQGEGTREWA
jgi:arsenate reductase